MICSLHSPYIYALYYPDSVEIYSLYVAHILYPLQDAFGARSGLASVFFGGSSVETFLALGLRLKVEAVKV